MIYLKQFENFKENFTIEILQYNVNESINENYNYGEYTIDHYNGKKEKVQLTDNQINTLNNYEYKLKSYLKEKNNFKGVYFNRQNQKIVRELNIELLKHYIEKFIRKDVEDIDGTKGFINPDLYEGIDLIYNNRDEITRFLFSKTIKDDDNVLVIMKNSSGYQIIVIIKKITKKLYKLLFKTQMKGRRSYNKDKSDRVVYLYPDGPKNNF